MVRELNASKSMKNGLLTSVLSAGGLLTGATFIVMSAALYMIFRYAPTERVQGDVQRLFYAHMSLAWVAYLSFFLVFLGGLIYLIRNGLRWDRLARSGATVGVVFTTLVLITGCLWGTRVWGVCWTWDARLTTTLILWFIYVGYLMLRGYVDDPRAKRRLAAIVGIVGFVSVPINFLSVYWWRTLHPTPTVLRAEGPSLPPPMLVTLLVALVAFTLLYALLMRMQMRLEGLADEVEELRIQRPWTEDAA